MKTRLETKELDFSPDSTTDQLCDLDKLKNIKPIASKSPNPNSYKFTT